MTTVNDNPATTDETDQNRRLIIKAAVDSFLQRGFPDSAMPDIVAESGVAPDVAYALFPSKYDVLRTLAAFNKTSGDTSFKELTDESPLPPAAELVTRVLDYFERMAASGAPAGLVPQTLGLALFDPEINVIMQEVAANIRKNWIGLATRLAQEGRLPEGADVQAVGTTLHTLGIGFMIYHMMGNIDSAMLRQGLDGLIIDR